MTEEDPFDEADEEEEEFDSLFEEAKENEVENEDEEQKERVSPETKRLLKSVGLKLVVGVSSLALVVTVLALAWTLAGPIDTIVYTVLFLFGATFIPMAVLLGAPSFPRTMKSIFGKLHFTLGQMTYGVGYLVQREDRWEMCPGTRDEVFVDGEWHEIEGGKTNLSVLGWKPFGILRFKTDETLREERVEFEDRAQKDWSVDEIATAEVSELVSDGGQSVPTIERAGVEEVVPKRSDVGENQWLIDLKRVYNRGLKKIGDISIIEKAEEVTMRAEASGSKVDGMEAIVGSIVGLVLGLATGYVMLGGV